MEEMRHFSHEEHSLKLIENWKMIMETDDEEKQVEMVVCHGCQEDILDGSVYGCNICRYFLHKKCADLEPTINHNFHSQHPLVLSVRKTNWCCNVCASREIKAGSLSYFCCMCDFDACITCVVAHALSCAATSALEEQAAMKFEHESHPQHTLTLQLRPATILCDACETEEKDLFYICNDCDFWIHKTCASLAPTINLPHHHNHPLLLAYSLPDNFYNFAYFCSFCKKIIRQTLQWVYHCANCREFSHIRCALNAEKQSSTQSESVSNAKELAENDAMMHFPMEDDSVDLLSLHFKKMIFSRPDNDGPIEINHWSHEHPLILISSNDDPIVVCYGCVRPLSFPFYSCKDGCDFHLHKYCAEELPREIQYQFHVDHSLQLVDFVDDPDWWFYKCSICFKRGNTFVYKCTTCKFYLDVSCSFLPNTIKHEKHQHPLLKTIDHDISCNACNNKCNGMVYECKACNFQLHRECAVKAPRFLSHRYCKGHLVPLIYPPVPDHPQNFYCDICETEMHPKYWLYYCAKCDSTFHINCIQHMDPYENSIRVGTITDSYHKHPITYVRRKKSGRHVCSACNLDINDHLILECRTCDFKICMLCHFDSRRLRV